MRPSVRSPFRPRSNQRSVSIQGDISHSCSGERWSRLRPQPVIWIAGSTSPAATAVDGFGQAVAVRWDRGHSIAWTCGLKPDAGRCGQRSPDNTCRKLRDGDGNHTRIPPVWRDRRWSWHCTRPKGSYARFVIGREAPRCRLYFEWGRLFGHGRMPCANGCSHLGRGKGQPKKRAGCAETGASRRWRNRPAPSARRPAPKSVQLSRKTTARALQPIRCAGGQRHWLAARPNVLSRARPRSGRCADTGLAPAPRPSRQ